ncbi:SDR family NAD(P)-dependent oxidoreductase [Gordonia sp. CPCC 205333]|uniref:SDR family NAD(P)-dependent oxidoreductase n=1 Tax=Gordonia sp. CPCC 205333 TaxID=3140790 RepID=UPI003AF3D9FA
MALTRRSRRQARYPLVGRVIAITGGARGLGLATALELRDAGAHVAIGDIDEAQVNESAASAKVLGAQVDVTSRDSVGDFMDLVEAELGPIDVYVNNAGVMPVGSLLGYQPGLISRTVDIDLLGVIHGTQLAAQRMVERGDGHIVNVASIAGRLAAPGLSIYNAAKFGVIGFSEAASGELGPLGVAVSTVQPSFARTALIDGIDFPGPTVTPENVARGVRYAIETRRLHTVVPGYIAGVAGMGLMPGTLKRRLLSQRRYYRLFMSPDTERRGDYDARVAQS